MSTDGAATAGDGLRDRSRVPQVSTSGGARSTESSTTAATPALVAAEAGTPAPSAAGAGAGSGATTDEVTAPVEVEKEEPPHAVQIIEINKEGTQFHLHEDRLKKILDKIPKGMPVATFALVGAFRTGKSFMLDLILKYLRYHDNLAKGEGAKAAGSDTPAESLQENPEWLMATPTVGGRDGRGADEDDGDTKDGFKWRPGTNRHTAGIWMWSQHFERVLPHSDSKAAVLIIDTQGLFDSEASQGITRVIFAFTALISSNIVYNIKQQLQEDFLSQVALFSSWGLICHQHMNDAAAAMQRAIASSASSASGDGSDAASGAGAGAGSGAGAGAGSTEGDSGKPPYQRLDFLVRDSTEMDVEILSEFEDEMPTPDDVAAICGKMDNYLQTFLSKDTLPEQKEIRQQIAKCFEEVGCFLLPHPGKRVARTAKYAGEVSDIDPAFRQWVNVYIQRLFRERLRLKKYGVGSLTASDLFAYMSEFAQIFQDPEHFPDPDTAVAAQAKGMNRAAREKAVRLYKGKLDALVGVGKNFVASGRVEELHKEAHAEALAVFESKAARGFGPVEHRAEQKQEMLDAIDGMRKMYFEMNTNRDPFKNFYGYAIPLAIGVIAWILSNIIHISCGGWAEVCSSTSEFLSLIYIVVFFIALLSMAVTGKGAIVRLRALVSFLFADVGKTKTE